MYCVTAPNRMYYVERVGDQNDGDTNTLVHCCDAQIECDKCINSKLKINYVRVRADLLLLLPPPPNRFILPEMINLRLHFYFSLSAHVPVEPMMPPYQIIRDPSGQFVFLPTATSMGMLRSHDIFHFN